MHILAIHAYTGTYMHVPITVGRGLWGAVADTLWPHSGHSGGAVDLTVPEPLRAFLHAQRRADASMVQGLKRPLRLCSKAVTASKFLFINYDL